MLLIIPRLVDELYLSLQEIIIEPELPVDVLIKLQFSILMFLAEFLISTLKLYDDDLMVRLLPVLLFYQKLQYFQLHLNKCYYFLDQ